MEIPSPIGQGHGGMEGRGGDSNGDAIDGDHGIFVDVDALGRNPLRLPDSPSAQSLIYST